MSQQPHDWVRSTLEHGETMCSRCSITNREAAVLGEHTCEAPDIKESKPMSEPRPTIFPAEWVVPAEFIPPRFDLVAHLHRARAFSEKAFGPASRPHGIVEHIRKELKEIEAQPNDLEEWIDVMILAIDGAWRAGYEPEEIVAALAAKQTKNEARKWPDWRTVPEGAPIEHDRSAE